ncbi:MAG TPA: isocitrate lyase/phosphoenolpyruvate mutase family protein [Gaiellaceae bacterium]|nr:isocitrate lyase/phosphoenolpyruvate mutase family protein [Gaiellaceae bacterium]
MNLEAQCELLRSLHVPGSPLVLPNAWDVASAKAVVDAGFPVVATTSGGVAAALGFEDHEGAPADEMFAAAARMAHAVDVPLTVDAEAGYGLEPAELVDALQEASSAGCNLEDTNHSSGALRDPHEHAAWLREVRDAAGYPLVVNARIDVFLADRETPQSRLVPEALERARTYLDAGVDCVYPIFLREADALATFVSEAPGPVNVLAFAEVPSLAELAEMGVARVSYGSLLHRLTMDAFASALASIPAHPA